VNDADRQVSLASWTVGGALLGFLCLAHLGVLLSYAATGALSAAVAPIAFAAGLLIADRLGRQAGLSLRSRVGALGAAGLVTAISLGISAWFFDLSWDGQWYHQLAIYHLERDWNPLAEPMRAFTPAHAELWVRHYAKMPWYVAAAVFKTFGQIEPGKCVNWLILAAMFAAVLAACLDAGMRRGQATVLATVVSLNPVVWSEHVTYLVDGFMVSGLAICAAALLSSFHRPSRLLLFTAFAAVICTVNSKQTGLVFLCFLCAAGGIYCLIARRDLVWRYAAFNLAALTLGVFVWGYNPYVTNSIHRGHPFYPQLGNEEYPGLTDSENDGVERWETPANMVGRHLWVRFFYATFGRPGNAPYNGERDAELIWPFTSRLHDMVVYRFHEVRVAGFGPYFGGALLLSLVLLVWASCSPGIPRGPLLLGWGAVLATLLLSKHFWWPRYAPQTWFLPLVPVVAVFWHGRSRSQVRLAWALVGILLVDAGIVAAVHLDWEARASHRLRTQLVELRRSDREIEVDLQWFAGPVAERFKTWGIRYREVERGSLSDGTALMSVVDGYPGEVHYRIIGAGVEDPAPQ